MSIWVDRERDGPCVQIDLESFEDTMSKVKAEEVAILIDRLAQKRRKDV